MSQAQNPVYQLKNSLIQGLNEYFSQKGKLKAAKESVGLSFFILYYAHLLGNRAHHLEQFDFDLHII